jgi:hypothetical protein
MHKIKRGDETKCASMENRKRRIRKAISSAGNAELSQKRKSISANPRKLNKEIPFLTGYRDKPDLRFFLF